jgi:mannose-6-phosphate isomerase-like protein (cupin superfamily)
MLIRRDEVPEVAQPEDALTLRALAPSRVTGRDLSLTWVALAGRHRRLRTRRSTRLYYVLDGSARFVLGDGEPVDAHRGDVVVIPRDTPYELAGELTYLVINSPGYVEGDDEYE